MRRAATFTTGLALLALGACGSDEQKPKSKSGMDPANFSTRIDNPYLPFAVGNRWVYREVEDGVVQKVVVTVTPRTRLIANGVRARVVHDQVTAGGRVKEDTFDWYAQDRGGTVWYLGEDTTEYPTGKKPSKAGSFEAGVKGAQAGIAMPAHPRPGMSYRQEYFKGEAEDRGKVLRLNAKAKVPYGSFDQLLLTEDSTPLEPDATEHKYYARGVGSILEVAVAGNARAELVSFTRG
jgi:hypothetical protein